MNRPLLYLAVLILFSTGCESSNSSPGTGTLRGNIFDATTNQKLSNVKVSIEGVSKSFTTASDGEFNFVDLNPGNVVLEYTKDDFGVGKSDLIYVASGDISYIPLALESLSGVWTLNGVWDAGGPPFNSTLTIKNDLTFRTTSSSGSWSLTNRSLLLNHQSGTKYSGNVVSSQSMSGTMQDFNGFSGTWTATR